MVSGKVIGGAMLARVVRAVLGTVLLVVGLPLLLIGAALLLAMQHQDSAGGYSASLSTVATDGYAIVVSDVDGLLRQEAPFARSGRTTLRVSAHTERGAAFIGLAPAGDIARYLADVPYTAVEQVRLARGPLPVASSPVDGAGAPAGPPAAQSFWVHTSRGGTLEWGPHELRDRQLALVVMAADGTAPLTADITARVHPQWLGSTMFGLVVLGTVLVLVALALLMWPSRSREIVYVVPPAQLPEIAAYLGVPPPRSALNGSALDGPALGATTAASEPPEAIAVSPEPAVAPADVPDSPAALTSEPAASTGDQAGDPAGEQAAPAGADPEPDPDFAGEAEPVATGEAASESAAVVNAPVVADEPVVEAPPVLTRLVWARPRLPGAPASDLSEAERPAGDRLGPEARRVPLAYEWPPVNVTHHTLPPTPVSAPPVSVPPVSVPPAPVLPVSVPPVFMLSTAVPAASVSAASVSAASVSAASVPAAQPAGPPDA